MRMTLRAGIIAALLFTAAPAFAARDYVDIEKRLTAEQMQATGLNQLSGDQLQLLNSLLRDNQKAIVESVREDSEKRVLGAWLSRDGVEPIASTVKGDLRGWSRGTVFTLANGERWRVTEGEYYVGKSLDGANVLVTPGKISGWYLQVQGHNPQPKVQRLD